MDKMTNIKKKKKKFHLSKRAVIILVSIVVVIAAIVGGILIWLYCGDKECTYCGRNTFSNHIYKDGTVVCCEFCYDDMFEETGVEPDEYYNKKSAEPEFTDLESLVYTATSGKAKASDYITLNSFLNTLTKIYVTDTNTELTYWAVAMNLVPVVEDGTYDFSMNISVAEAIAILESYGKTVGLQEYIFYDITDSETTLTCAKAAKLIIDYCTATGADTFDYTALKDTITERITELKSAEAAYIKAVEEAAKAAVAATIAESETNA